MRCTIERSLSGRGFRYEIKGKANLKGEANYTFGLLCRKLTVLDEINNVIYKLSQPNVWLAILVNLIPILRLLIYPYYRYYENDCIRGRTFRKEDALLFKIEEHLYEMRRHSNLYVSIMKNNTQVALIKKLSYSEFEKHTLEVQYSSALETNFSILFLLCVFLDIRYFQKKTRFNLVEDEVSYVIGDKHTNRVSWRPEI